MPPRVPLNAICLSSGDHTGLQTASTGRSTRFFTDALATSSRYNTSFPWRSPVKASVRPSFEKELCE